MYSIQSLTPAPDHITKLAPNEIFVYGSNEAFRHGRGAARAAIAFGAQHGIGPFCGQTYGISTKDREIKTLGWGEIAVHVEAFTRFVKSRPDLMFLVTQVGCGLAGYKPHQIAPLFMEAARLPNVRLPQVFIDTINEGLEGMSEIMRAVMDQRIGDAPVIRDLLS